MRTKKFASVFAGGAALALVLTGCGGSTESGGDAAIDAPYEVATDVSLEGSPTYDSIVEADSVVIGVKEDQPGLGYRDAVTGEYTGFDIEVAKWVAASLGFGADKIEYVAIPSQNRESAIINGDVDLYVGTYSITDERKEQIGFAGPYFATGQGILVERGNEEIQGPDDLAGQTVCSVTGSTPIQNIRDNYPEAETVEFGTYSECVDQMNDGRVDAVTTDEAILLGYAAENSDELEVVGEPFSEELYGIGLAKDDDVLRDAINTTLEDGAEEWQSIYDQTLGRSGTSVEQPAVDRY